jgi:hypothetical protein
MSFALLRDLSFQAALLNVLLMSGYVWLDHGRGFVALHPDVTNALFIAFGWSCIVNQLVYLVTYSGSTPWPAGWTILSEWLGLFGSFTYASTSLLYSDETGAYITVVCVVEALGATLYIASAITAAAGWWLDRPFSIERGVNSKDGPLVVRVLKDPVAWAHLTNFVPAIVYVSSSLTVLETHFSRPVSRADAGTPAFSPLLRQLSRIYWYGDILWLANGLLWLWLCVQDFEAEEETAESSGTGRDAAIASSTGAPLSAFTESLLGSFEGGLTAIGAPAPLNLQHGGDTLDDDNFSSASAITSPGSVDGLVPALRRQKRKRVKALAPEKPSRILRNSTPYEVLGPFKRTVRCLFRTDATESLELGADPTTAGVDPSPKTRSTAQASVSARSLRIAVGAAATVVASSTPVARSSPAIFDPSPNGLKFSLRLPPRGSVRKIEEELELQTLSKQ